MNTKQAWEGSRAKQVYEYLCDYYLEWGIMPSYRNVALAFNTSTSVYTHYLRRMEEEGLIEWRYKHPGSKYRDIMLVGALHLPPYEVIGFDQLGHAIRKYTGVIDGNPQDNPH